MTIDDAALRAAWQRLEARRTPADDSLLPMETIAALAASDADDAVRAAQLDVVLGHPVMAAEYALLREVAAGRSSVAPTRQRWSPSWLAAAAALLLVAGAGLFWPRAGDDPLRSAGSALALVSPDDGAAEIRFRWRSYAGATRYRFEIVSAEGTVLAEQETTDTSVVLAAPIGEPGVWRVTATLPDGQQIASPTRRVQPTP